MFDSPRGGTELMMEELMKRLPNSYKNIFSIFNYLQYADFSKKTVYWVTHSYDQQVVKILENKELVDKIDYFVFVSHWQSELFRKAYNIPGYKSYVIKNACIGVEKRLPRNDDKVKLCYTSTPWRGLDVLIDAWKNIDTKDCELHVFSNTIIYGQDYAEVEDWRYKELYDECKNTPGIVYRGVIPNEDLRSELSSFDILAYPSTFEETSCIAVIDALSAGLRVACSNIGALPETTEGWAKMYTFMQDKERHSLKFSKILSEEIQYIKEGRLEEYLNYQRMIYKNKWSWDARISEWTSFLDGLITTS